MPHAMRRSPLGRLRNSTWIKEEKKPCSSLICTFQPGENSLPTRCDCTSQLTHVGFLKRTVFDEKEALMAVIPWPSSFRDAGLSDHVQMQKVPSCSSNETNTNRKF